MGASVLPIVRAFGPDGASCDGHDPTLRGFVAWLVAALDAQRLHVTWVDDWGRETSSRDWLCFDEDWLAIDWRGFELVGPEPFRPESEARRARTLYYGFIRTLLAPDWTPPVGG